MALTRTVNGKTYEVLRFPMKIMNITQGNNGQFSHKGVNALDIAGKDTGIDPTFAPCKMHLVTTDSYANGNAVFMQSDNPVLFADGTIDYATMIFLHDNNIADIRGYGKSWSQWQEFGDEGTAGYATGNHCHFEVAKGKFSHMYDRNGYGTYHLPGSISADKACVVDGVTIRNGAGMAWKKAADVKVAAAAPVGSGTWRQDVALKKGDVVRSVSCQIAGTNGNLVNVPALGGQVPLVDVTESSDTKDGRCDDYLANTNARVFLDNATVTKIVSNSVVTVKGKSGAVYNVLTGPLMAKR